MGIPLQQADVQNVSEVAGTSTSETASQGRSSTTLLPEPIHDTETFQDVAQSADMVLLMVGEGLKSKPRVPQSEVAAPNAPSPPHSFGELKDLDELWESKV